MPSVGCITSRASERLLKDPESRQVATPFGEATVLIGFLAGHEAACVERYGPHLTVPSHKINYRANIWALRSLGVRRLVSQNAIGSLNRMLRPGDVVIPSDLLDRTHGRPHSLFDESDAWVRVDLTEAFCPSLRKSLIEATARFTQRWFPTGVFVCSEGPRLETPAEVEAFRREGGDIIGTPVATELVLAREAGICFASIAPVINFGAGLAPKVDHAEMNDFYYTSGLHDVVEDSITAAVDQLPEQRGCRCYSALDGAYFGDSPAWMAEWPESEVNES